MYEQESTEKVHNADRRFRDAYTGHKRREGDEKMRCDHVSERELELLARIDAHILRIAATNGVTLA